MHGSSVVRSPIRVRLVYYDILLTLVPRPGRLKTDTHCSISTAIWVPSSADDLSRGEYWRVCSVDGLAKVWVCELCVISTGVAPSP